ncbi:MAG: Guanine deaminase [Bacteroidetes bacterium OLB9]|nr:MAG: Guanine deaminase [Bacteroidetes bacterium OLB9]
MQAAFDAAASGMENNEGGPFGAVVVLEGKIIGRGNNKVTSHNDPTAHAEVVAIRDACKTMQTFHLPDAIIYTNCEPCPMCMAAIYWANIKTVYYYYDRHQAEDIGFSDKFIYDEFEKPINERSVAMKKIDMVVQNDVFDGWKNKSDKTPY